MEEVAECMPSFWFLPACAKEFWDKLMKLPFAVDCFGLLPGALFIAWEAMVEAGF